MAAIIDAFNCFLQRVRRTLGGGIDRSINQSSSDVLPNRLITNRMDRQAHTRTFIVRLSFVAVALSLLSFAGSSAFSDERRSFRTYYYL